MRGLRVRYISLFSGIEAASVAFGPLGWNPICFAEIEAFPSAVLAHHYPDVPNVGDMTKHDWSQYRGACDLVVGGPPCQAFSVAGLRLSMEDDRGNLSLQYMRAVHAIDPVWSITENVPGWLSTKDNAFGCFLAGLVGEDAELRPPGGRWTDAGLVTGPERTAAWCIKDAQFYGVAQRRRRVFVLSVRGIGNWRCAEALFPIEPGMCRNFAPRREAGKSAPTIPSRSTAGGGLGTDFDLDGGLDRAAACEDSDTYIPVISPALKSRDYKGPSSDGDGDGDGDGAPLIAHSLRAEGFDASEDGTGRGTPIVSVMAFGAQMSTPHWQDGLSDTLQAKNPKAICFSSKDHGADAIDDLAPTLRAGGHADSHANAGVPPAIAFALRGREGGAMPEVHDQVSALRAASGGATRDFVALPIQYAEQHDRDKRANGMGLGEPGDPMFTLETRQPHGVAVRSAVRRLTPTECARLQGFPEYENSITIFVCSSDRQKIAARAEIQSLRSQKHVSGAQESASPQRAQSVENPFSTRLLGQEWPVAVNARIDFARREVEISSQGRLLWSANNVERKSSSPLPMPIDDFVLLAAPTMGCLVQGAPLGRAAAIHHSTSPEIGIEFAALSASEITALASDAPRLRQMASDLMMSITSRVPPSSPNYDSLLATWSFCVAAAISSFTPESMSRTSSYALRVTASTDYLSSVRIKGKAPADGPMYKALGNSMAVPVMNWIGRRIALVDALPISPCAPDDPIG